MPRRLVLASTSVYRQELLSRLGYPFEVAAPMTDEAAIPGESPLLTALRLSEQKAKAVAAQYPDALIIGSDQVAHLGDIIFGKPGNHERAVQQLRQLSGNSVNFVSGVSVYDSANQQIETRGVVTKVTFRELSESTIEAYLRKEQPYNCAGSAKSEGLGIALIARMECDDPTALIGLPLIALCDLLKTHGLSLI
jgi:septum formation protein